MQNYIQEKMKLAKPIVTESPPPPVQQPAQEQILEEPFKVNNEYIKQKIKLNIFRWTIFLIQKHLHKELVLKGYAFVNFGAPWCSHCQKISTDLESTCSKISSI